MQTQLIRRNVQASEKTGFALRFVLISARIEGSLHYAVDILARMPVTEAMPMPRKLFAFSIIISASIS